MNTQNTTAKGKRKSPCENRATAAENVARALRLRLSCPEAHGISFPVPMESASDCRFFKPLVNGDLSLVYLLEDAVGSGGHLGPGGQRRRSHGVLQLVAERRELVVAGEHVLIPCLLRGGQVGGLLVPFDLHLGLACPLDELPCGLLVLGVLERHEVAAADEGRGRTRGFVHRRQNHGGVLGFEAIAAQFVDLADGGRPLQHHRSVTGHEVRYVGAGTHVGIDVRYAIPVEAGGKVQSLLYTVIFESPFRLFLISQGRPCRVGERQSPKERISARWIEVHAIFDPVDLLHVLGHPLKLIPRLRSFVPTSHPGDVGTVVQHSGVDVPRHAELFPVDLASSPRPVGEVGHVEVVRHGGE